MERMERPLRSLDDTRLFARDLAGLLRPGDVVELDGPLGAGKTTLVREVARALGVSEREVASPTFVLMRRYGRREGPDLVHIDAYRLGEDELDTLGLDALGGDEILLIEWAERLGGQLVEQLGERAAGALRLGLAHESETTRRVRIEFPPAWRGRPGLAALEPRPPTRCPVTGRPVPGDSPTWPFVDERARLVDLGQWMDEGYVISRPAEQKDLEEGQD